MKKTTLIIIVMSVLLNANAQENKIDTTGNIGIGITNPKSKLHLFEGASDGNPHSFSSITVEDSTNSMISILTPNTKTAYFGFADSDDDYVGGMQYEHSKDRLVFRTNNHTSDLIINNNGNVGIGVLDPNATLQIGDSDHTGSPNTEVEVKRLSLSPVTHFGSDWFFTVRDNKPYANLDIGYSSKKALTLRHDGNIGIGTTNPDMKLTVNGNIHAKEIKVDLNIPAPDYVFEEDYDLRSIAEVEKYIKTNGHLPEIPSAKEFEENGVMQVEMDMNLLKKIEELMLYTIQQQKEIESQAEEIRALKKYFKN